jgi:hypothetical protein
MMFNIPGTEYNLGYPLPNNRGTIFLLFRFVARCVRISPKKALTFWSKRERITSSRQNSFSRRPDRKPNRTGQRTTNRYSSILFLRNRIGWSCWNHKCRTLIYLQLPSFTRNLITPIIPRVVPAHRSSNSTVLRGTPAVASLWIPAPWRGVRGFLGHGM